MYLGAPTTFLEGSKHLEWSHSLLNFTIRRIMGRGCLTCRFLCPLPRGQSTEGWAEPGVLRFQTSVPR